MEIVLINALSLNMLPPFSEEGELTYNKLSLRETADYICRHCLEINAIGHADTDAIVRNLLASEGCSVPMGERANIILDPKKGYIVAQYRGPRLPEGATALPEGATIEFYLVYLIA